MKANELPGWAPGDDERDYDLDDLTGDEVVEMGTFPTHDYECPDEGWIEMLMDAFQSEWPETGLPPVIVWEGEGHPYEIITGRHRLTAANRIGWSTYPAFVVKQRR